MITTRAYLVEPLAGTIRPVALPVERRLDTLRSLIGCETIDAVRLDARLTIILDDTGLHEALPSVTEVEGYASPLAGNLIVIGTDADGETVDVAADIGEVARRLTILRPVLDPVFETLTGPRILGARLSALAVRLDRQSPVVSGKGGN